MLAKELADAPKWRSALEPVDLMNFLHQNAWADTLYHIVIPQSPDELPSIEISREMCQALIAYAWESTQKRNDQ